MHYGQTLWPCALFCPLSHPSFSVLMKKYQSAFSQNSLLSFTFLLVVFTCSFFTCCSPNTLQQGSPIPVLRHTTRPRPIRNWTCKSQTGAHAQLKSHEWWAACTCICAQLNLQLSGMLHVHRPTACVQLHKDTRACQPTTCTA